MGGGDTAHRYGGGMVVVCVVTLCRLFKLPTLTSSYYNNNLILPSSHRLLLLVINKTDCSAVSVCAGGGADG